jgi:hypothetical protein
MFFDFYNEFSGVANHHKNATNFQTKSYFKYQNIGFQECVSRTTGNPVKNEILMIELSLDYRVQKSVFELLSF